MVWNRAVSLQLAANISPETSISTDVVRSSSFPNLLLLVCFRARSFSCTTRKRRRFLRGETLTLLKYRTQLR